MKIVIGLSSGPIHKQLIPHQSSTNQEGINSAKNAAVDDRIDRMVLSISFDRPVIPLHWNSLRLLRLNYTVFDSLLMLELPSLSRSSRDVLD